MGYKSNFTTIHAHEFMNKNDHVYNPLVESQDMNDDIIYFMKEQDMESSFQFMCYAYNSRTRSKDVQGDHMGTRLVHAWKEKKVLAMRQKVKPLKTKRLHQWIH
jgi:hypothetical protein